MMLLQRWSPTLASRLLSHPQRHRPRDAPRSIARFRSSVEEKWPAVHPKKKRLKRIKNVLRGKDPKKALHVPEPTTRQLYVVALHQSIPFVGFGFMDNSILLLAGGAIDIYLGVALGISTMCAAAIGNIVSDLAGVAFGTVIEDALFRWSKRIETITRGWVRIPPMPKLTHEQRNLRSVRLSSQMGCAVGLTIGCVIGMFPLLFFPEDEKPKDQQGEDPGASASPSEQVVALQNKQLMQEIRKWKVLHASVEERLKVLQNEKDSALWDQGY